MPPVEKTYKKSPAWEYAWVGSPFPVVSWSPALRCMAMFLPNVRDGEMIRDMPFRLTRSTLQQELPAAGHASQDSGAGTYIDEEELTPLEATTVRVGQEVIFGAS